MFYRNNNTRRPRPILSGTIRPLFYLFNIQFFLFFFPVSISILAIRTWRRVRDENSRKITKTYCNTSGVSLKCLRHTLSVRRRLFNWTNTNNNLIGMNFLNVPRPCRNIFPTTPLYNTPEINWPASNFLRSILKIHHFFFFVSWTFYKDYT